MATQDTTTQETPQKAEKFVLDAVRAVGEKFKELTDEQRQRALTAPTEKSGLRGKALGRWIVDGEDLGAQVDKAQEDRQVAEAAEAAKKAEASGEKRAQYPANVRAAVKRSNAIRGKSHGAGPKQHVHVRKVVTAELKKQKAEPTPLSLAKLAGFSNVAELHAAAAGEAPRDALKVMHPLAAQMGDDPWCKGRHLAAALAAWGEELQAAKKGS